MYCTTVLLFVLYGYYTVLYYCDMHPVKPIQHLTHTYHLHLSHCYRGAFIRQFLVDDKGCVLIALWGVPSASYVDNAGTCQHNPPYTY
jgi:hypothetical protein